MTNVTTEAIKPSGILIFPDVTRWSATCGRPGCACPPCNALRDQVKRLCHVCEQPIAAGSKFREYRDPVSKKLLMQEHVTCPVRR